MYNIFIFSGDDMNTNANKMMRRDTYQSVGNRSTLSYTSQREIMHDQQLSYLTKENQLIKKYLIISHVAVITTISVILFVIISDLLGFIIIDMLIQCICVAFMNKSYDKYYNKLCIGSIFMFDLCEECGHCCDRDNTITMDEEMIEKGYDESEVQGLKLSDNLSRISE